MSSRNPFRQARNTRDVISPASDAGGSSIFEFQSPSEQDQPATKRSSKPRKRVVIKTPPRSPEEVHRRPSLGRSPSPPPIPEVAAVKFGLEDADTDSNATADSDLEQAIINTRRNSGGAEPLQSPVMPGSINAVKAPYNPFARTLATSEQRYDSQRNTAEPEQDAGRSQGMGKPSFDVDMFKNILLNGAKPPAGVSQAEIPPKQEQSVGGTGDGPASISQQQFESRFPDLNKERPRTPEMRSTEESDTSSDEEDESDESRPPIDDTAQTMPSRVQQQKGPQTVSFADFDDGSSFSLPSLRRDASNELAPNTSAPSSNALDTNKPLPAPPTTFEGQSVASPNSEIETSTITKASPAPPPPPTSRRQPQSGSQSRARSSSVLSRTSIQSDTSGITPPVPKDSAKAPPPPPSRRSQPTRTLTSTTIDDAASDVISPISEQGPASPPPAPAPRRTPNPKIDTSSHRTSLQPVTETTPNSSTAPPRPPPRRMAGSNRSSIDSSLQVRRTSQQDSRRASGESADATPILNHEGASRADLLSDLAALQKEVDELRAKAAAG